MAETDKDDLVTLLQEDDQVEDIPDKLPLMPVRDVVIFPDMVLPLYIGREKSIQAVELAMETDRMLFLATQKDPSLEDPSPDEIFRVGTVCRILRVLKLPEGHFKVLIQGIEKGKIARYTAKKYNYNVKINLIPDIYFESIEV